MSFRWTNIFFVLACIAQPGLAQVATPHKATIKHKATPHSTTVHKKTSKAKHHPTSSKAAKTVVTTIKHKGNSSIAETSTQVIAANIPQPQFDSIYPTSSTPVITKVVATKKPVVATAPSPIIDIPADTNVAAPADSVLDDAEIDTSQAALTALAYKTVETQRYSSYKLGGTVFDTKQGIYKIDCSAYVNDLLSEANPLAYSSLTNLTQTFKPTSHDYYKFFTHLPEQPLHYWRKINSIEQLQPGGILVFLTQYLRRHQLHAGSGHVMLVMSKPIPHPNSADTFQVQVADSAPSGHSDDTRLPHKSGIGIGTLLLKVDPFTGQPKAYAWKLNAHWRSHTLFAMAQPTGATE